MVYRKNLVKKYALISVHDKSKLKYLCANLIKNDYILIATTSTAKKIKSFGFNSIDISKITKFKEILDGRVKTLHPKIFSSILFDRKINKHVKQFKKLNVPRIDIVVVNLYPFEKYKNNLSHNKSLDMIDIGGCSLIRASGKNYKYVTTISDTNDYKLLIENLKNKNGVTDILFRKKMASKAFSITSKYDSLISHWILKNKEKNNKLNLRYGENPDQKAYIVNNGYVSISKTQISGKKISYNNILDVDSGIKCLSEFKEPTCVIIKHNNPCGVASSSKINIAYKKALNSDIKSAFGGIVLVNREINIDLADGILKNYYEVIVAPNYSKQAENKLRKKEGLVILKLGKFKLNKFETKQTLFGDITQKVSDLKINKNFFISKAYKKDSKKIIEELIFATKVVKHLKSNAIVLASNKQTVGIGTGQTNRIDSLQIALKNYKQNFRERKFVCVSDGFFPFTDSLKLLNKNKCKVVAQPSGSIRDLENIKYAINNKMSLYFLKNRLFRH